MTRPVHRSRFMHPTAARLDEPEIDWIAIPSSGSNPGPLQPSIELAIDPSQLSEVGQEAPVVGLAPSVDGRRVVLGRLAIGGRTARLLAIELGEARDNRALQRDFDALEDGQGLGSVELLALGRRGDPGLGEPTLLCRERVTAVAVRHPESLRPLVPSADKELLGRVGLTDGWVLHDPAEVRPGSPELSLFRWGDESAEHQGTAGSRLVTGARAFRRMSWLVAGGAPDGVEPEALASFACWECPERRTCYLPGDDGSVAAERRLVPVAFYGTDVVVAEALPVHLDELGDLLGGAAAATVAERVPEGEKLGRSLLLHRAEEALGRGPRWLSARNDLAGRVRESLFLKLAAWHQAVQALQAFHGSTRRPHLAVGVESFMARVGSGPGGGQSLPVGWSFDVRLVTHGAHTPWRDPRGGEVVALDLWQPLGSVSDATESVPVRVRLGASDPRQPQRVAQVRVDTVSTGSTEESLAVEVGGVISLSQGGDGPRFVGIVEEFVGRALVARVELIAGGADVGQLPLTFDAELAVHPVLDCASDHRGLGEIGCRLLFGNDRRDARRSVELGLELTRRVEQGCHDVEDRREFAAEVIRDALLEDPDIFDAAGLLYAHEERTTVRGAVPQADWIEVLRLVVGCLSDVPDLSFAVSARRERRSGESVLAAFELQLARVVRRARASLGAEAAFGRDVDAACGTILAELRAATQGGES